MSINSETYDVAIIGGGPAGSSLGAYLAKAGVSCAIFEREIFPREHVGESLVPSSNRIFKDLELFERFEEAGFIKKYGAAWTTVNSSRIFSHDHTEYNLRDGVSIRFNERPQEGVEKEYTYQVDRAKFDQIILQKAVFYGAKLYMPSTVTKVSIDPFSGVTVQYRHKDEEKSIEAKMIVDASGRGTVLGRQLKLKLPDSNFNQFAIHTWFENFDRNEGELKDYIFIHFLPYQHSWIWQIPITNAITSIGLVTSKKHIEGDVHDMESIFYSFLKKQTELGERIKNATRVKPFKVESDYSYSMTQIVGDRFLLIGDAARYVDPIFSSGVSIALNAAKFAAPDIIAAIRQNQFAASAFANYEKMIERGCKNWYEFINMYYRLNVLFTYFVSHPKYKMEVIRFLQGDVYDDEESFLLRDMRALLTKVESSPSHIWHRLLNNIKTAEVSSNIHP